MADSASRADLQGNLGRFSGFADLYDANRPTAPDGAGALIAAYAGVLVARQAGRDGVMSLLHRR